ncbi:OmpA family protein [Mariniflexile ostreae]|uniref:OmpA family protein n=1 Tax=Mariniflexile ostreae TaxID=1520892 RepID=A0ABV5FAU8_9FLAO
MKLRSIILVFGLFITNTTLFAQNTVQKKADNLFNSFSFYKAAETYKTLISQDFNTDYATRKLADCYAFMRNPDSASVYYKKTVVQNNVPVEYLYHYAQSLRGIGEYEASRMWFENYKKKGGLIDVQRFSNDAQFINAIYHTKQRYFLKEVLFNTEFSEFGAYNHYGDLYFTSTRDAGVAKKFKSGWDNQPFLDVYVIKKGSTHAIVDTKSKIKGKVNSVYHDGPITITKDGKTMYFSRNNFNKNTLKRDQHNIGNLKIYKASLIKDKWRKIKALRFNSEDYSTGHPALNHDGTKLYFTSDMPGGFGGTDIYYVPIRPDGTMGKPKNLGPIVNTKKNESFPFINKENVLFFSSDGHLGLGLLDVFAAVTDVDNTIVSTVNLGVPINSSKDDFSFFTNDDGATGYFASNRKGGVGSDDIYAFHRTALLKIESNVIDAKGDPIVGATGVLLNAEGHHIASLQSDKQGKFEIDIDRDEDYVIQIRKENYTKESKQITSKHIEPTTTSIKIDMALSTHPKKHVPDAIPLEIPVIQFEYNKFNINKNNALKLDRIVDLMIHNYPNIIIKIESHTDSRGSAKYNDILSKKRAQSTYKYFVSKGINTSRITEYVGYGKRKPLHVCNVTTNCTEAQHQLNRRTEVIVVNKQ